MEANEVLHLVEDEKDASRLQHIYEIKTVGEIVKDFSWKREI